MPRALRPRLLLVWKDPATRLRYTIGHLWSAEGGFFFRYEVETPRSFLDARDRGFTPLEAFPDFNKVYASRRLFPVFMRRVMPLGLSLRSLSIDRRRRPDDAAFDVLWRLGGRSSTDTLEFMEAGTLDRERNYVLRFEVAGRRYCEGRFHPITVGTAVDLWLERDNKFDPHAIKVGLPDGTHLGYVPAVYSWYLDHLVERRSYEARVLEVLADSGGDRVFVEFRGRGSIPPDLTRYVERLKG